MCVVYLPDSEVKEHLHSSLRTASVSTVETLLVNLYVCTSYLPMSRRTVTSVTFHWLYGRFTLAGIKGSNFAFFYLFVECSNYGSISCFSKAIR